MQFERLFPVSGSCRTGAGLVLLAALSMATSGCNCSQLSSGSTLYYLFCTNEGFAITPLVIETSRQMRCRDLLGLEVVGNQECMREIHVGGPVRKFKGKVGSQFFCQDVDPENPVEVEIDLSACTETARHANDVVYNCVDALHLQVARNTGAAYTFQSGAEAELNLSATRLDLAAQPVGHSLCDRDIDFVAVDFSFDDPIFNLDDPTDLPLTLIPTGFFEAAVFVVSDPGGQYIAEGRLNEEEAVGVAEAGYDCGSGGGTITCGPAPANPQEVGSAGSSSGSFIQVDVAGEFSPEILFTAAGRVTLDPGPLDVRVTRAGAFPAGEGDDEVFNLLFLPATSILPHVPFGETGPYRITTQVIVNNPHDEEVEGELQFFNTVDGEPLAVPLDGTDASLHSFSIGPLESRLLEIDGAGVDPPQIAWAFVQGSRTLTAASNFSTAEPGGTAAPAWRGPQGAASISAEAGIAASGVGLRHVLNVSRDGSVVDTAFAIVNPTVGTADVHLKLKTPAESGESQVVAEADLALGPHQQVARFFGEFFGLPDGDFLGTLEINSDTSLAVMSIRTLEGLQSSSLPSGTR